MALACKLPPPPCTTVKFYSFGATLAMLLFNSGAGGGAMTLLGVWKVKIEFTS